jgi:hypothetical protein
MIPRLGLAGGLVSMVAGCAVLSPLPDARTPADRAHELDAKCRAESEDGARAVVARDAIDSVEPYYVSIPASNGHENRMLGARVHVRPLPGLTRESLARALQCHEARVVLGLAGRIEDDPYVMDGDWLTIDVDSEGDGFVVAVHPVDFKGANAVLERAVRYARAPAARGP